MVYNEHINKVTINETLKQLFSFLNVTDKQTATEYKNILNDTHKKDDYLNLIRLLSKRELIKNKISKIKVNLTDYKAIYTSYYKISLIWELEDELKINRFNFTYLEDDKPYNINEDLLKRINTAYRTDRTTNIPKTYNEFIKFYTYKIKHIMGDIDIIDIKKTQINKIRRQVYKLNEIKLNNYLKLYELTDYPREYLIDCEYFYKKNEMVKQNITKHDFIDMLEELPDPGGLDFGI
jgi:predicted transcriptional regulator